MTRKVIINGPEFRARWDDKTLTCDAIGVLYGVTASRISQLAKKYGYPPRAFAVVGGAKLAKVNGAAPRAPASKSKPCPRLSDGHPFFTHDRDSAIWATGGKYVPLGALADRWGKPVTLLQQRLHKLRAV